MKFSILLALILEVSDVLSKVCKLLNSYINPEGFEID